jgi:HAE1 family hydrophobic/amphiphilic exporter-1
MTMVLLIFVVFGVIGFQSMSLDLMPTVDIPVVTITTVYPGAGPEEIENQITKKIEDEVATISEIDYFESYSIDNVSIIMIRFLLSKDGDIGKQEVKDKVDAILNDFPSGVDKPVIQKFEVGADPVVNLVLGGDASGKELYEYADKVLKDRFSQMQGVAKVDVIGGDERQVHVAFNNAVLKTNKISMAQVGQILAANNIDIPSGNYNKGNQDYTVKTKGKFENVDQIKDLDLPTAYGYKKLGQLATVTDTIKSVRERAMYFNHADQKLEENIVKISLIKSSDGNAVEIAKTVKEQLPEIEASLPDNMNLTITKDGSIFIESTVNDTISNILLGVLFTALILMFFLHDWRSTIIVALSMPFSIIATIGIAQMSGFTLNTMSLMALSTSVGIIVTNSVVVIENIFKHKERGENRKDAADKGTSEIFVAVLASTLTNLMVFLPIANMSGMAGRFFIEFALTVTYATIFSLITSFTLTPMLASLILPEHAKKGKLGTAIENMIKGLENIYAKTLHVVIDKKAVATFLLVLTIAILVFSMNLLTKVGMEFAPMMDEGDIEIKVELPQGYDLQSSKETSLKIIDIVKQHKEVEHTTIDLGRQSDSDQGVNLSLISVKLVEGKSRDIETAELAQKLIEECTDIPNAKISIAAKSSMGTGGDPIEFFVLGQNMEELIKYSEIIKDDMKKIPGITNVNSSYKAGKKEITVTPKRDKLSDLGTNVYELGLSLRYAVEGIDNTSYTENNEDYDLLVTMEDNEVNSIQDLENIPFTNGHGTKFTLNQVANIEQEPAYNQLQRRNKFSAIKITAGNAPGFTIGKLQGEINKAVEAAQLPTGYKIEWGGDAQMMGETNKDMGSAMMLAIVLTYMLLAAILESFTQPLIILVTLPLALIGVAIIMYVTGTAFNIISLLSIMMLIGIVVNNAILIMEYYNQLRSEGKRIREALVTASSAKLRPIIMSTISIIIGMLPMALGLGDAGAEMRQGMGLVTIGGVTSSMLLTLYILPAMISLGAKKKHL